MRVQHYVKYIDGKRKCEYHGINEEYLDSVEVNGSKLLEVNNLKLKSVSRNTGGRSLVWLGHQPATLTTRVQIPPAA